VSAKTKESTPFAVIVKTEKAPKTRSPNYPTLTLGEAIAKTGTLYEKNKRFAVPLATAASALDYGPKSSTFAQVVATLKSYGLVDITGTGDERKMAVSDRGMKIVADHRDKQALIQEAALSPAIWSELWTKFHKPGEGLAPVGAIDHYLKFDRPEPKFNHDVIGPLIADFKATVELAKLLDGAKLSGAGDGRTDSLEEPTLVAEPNPPNPPPPPPPLRPGMKQESFSLEGGDLIVRWPAKLSADELKDVEDWLDILKRKIKRAATSESE
jgi:hypothetical protein